MSSDGCLTNDEYAQRKSPTAVYSVELWINSTENISISASYLSTFVPCSDQEYGLNGIVRLQRISFLTKTDEMMKNHCCGKNIHFWRNLTKSPVLNCKTVAFLLFFCEFLLISIKYLTAAVVYINHYISNNIFSVNSTGFVSLTVLMMSLMTSYLVLFISDKKVNHNDSALLGTNPELYNNNSIEANPRKEL